MTLSASELGSRIAEARGRAGLTQDQLAREIGMDRSGLAKIETGARRVSALELSRIASGVNERVEWLLSDPVPAVISHRNMLEPGEPSPNIDAAVERFAYACEFVASQDQGLQETLSQLRHMEEPLTDDGMERLAERARTLIGVDQDEPLRELGSKLAEVGLLTWALTLGNDSADASSILLPQGALAVVNASLKPGRRRLALAHEFGHALLADDYSVDWRVDTGVDKREAAIDRFSRALLIPSASLSKLWTQWADRGDIRAAAVRTASHYRVDMTTLARRLKETGLLRDGDSALIRSTRTTKADIVEYNLVPADELESGYLSLEYVKAVLRIFRGEIIGEDRAIDLLLDTWPTEELPTLPKRNEMEIWEFVG